MRHFINGNEYQPTDFGYKYALPGDNDAMAWAELTGSTCNSSVHMHTVYSNIQRWNYNQGVFADVVDTYHYGVGQCFTVNDIGSDHKFSSNLN